MLTESVRSSNDSNGPRLLDRLRGAIRRSHYSRRTEEAYIHWTKRFIYFHDKRHPAELGEAAVTAFLKPQIVMSRRPPRIRLFPRFFSFIKKRSA